LNKKPLFWAFYPQNSGFSNLVEHVKPKTNFIYILISCIRTEKQYRFFHFTITAQKPRREKSTIILKKVKRFPWG